MGPRSLSVAVYVRASLEIQMKGLEGPIWWPAHC